MKLWEVLGLGTKKEWDFGGDLNLDMYPEFVYTFFNIAKVPVCNYAIAGRELQWEKPMWEISV